MNVSVEEKLMSRIHQLEKKLTHAVMKIELISEFLKQKFIDANFPIKMLGAVTLKRVKLVRSRTRKNLQKAKANSKVGNSREARKTIKVKSPSARNLDVADITSVLEIPIRDESQAQTSAELLNGKSANGDRDRANTITFDVSNDTNETGRMESSVTMNNVTGEASNRSMAQISELKKTLSVRLERMDVAQKDCSLSKHGAFNKSKAKASNFQQECSASKEGKRFKCTWKDCPRRFNKRYDLERHWRVHTGEKPFKCAWAADCNRRFKQLSHLTTHLNTHTGEKPLKCTWPDCGKSFTHECTLIRHRRCHTGEKPYSCTLCGESFSGNGSLTSHMRIHTGEKPFKCDLCGAEYRCRSSLRGHKKRHNLI